ncbi:hypothetical protein ILYODFUR_029148 [Ilyodon furcidens]|uniref:Uncharacterized protein n=1 Tax=Ilyodon furcidens TaxID=33524 RepID=A0ABV0TNR3_9TELE
MKADAKMQIYTFTQDQQSHYSKDIAPSGISTVFIPAATVQKTQRTQKPFSVPSPVSMPLDTPANVTSKVKLEGESLRQIPSQADVHSHSSTLTEIMKRQNEITEMLIKQQRQTLLPSIEIPVFSGDPLHFRSFLKALSKE